MSDTAKPPRTIAIDFDGVISDYQGWTGPVPTDPPVPGTREAIASLRSAGFRVEVFSCRALTEDGRAGIQAWLVQHGIFVDHVTALKPHAELYIDDRAVRFRGCWAEVIALLNTDELKPWNHRRARPAAAPFRPVCGTCGVAVGEVRADGTYAACGHSVPGVARG